METAPLKSFATWARTALIREVNARIVAVMAPASPERVEQPRYVAALEKEISTAGGGDKGRESVADRVAYTWFNRIIALRFMDANAYTEKGIVSPQSGIEVGQPEILSEAKRGNIDAEVLSPTTRDMINALLNDTRKSSDPQGEAYALLLAEYCRHWNRAMPFMFEREGDFTELLIPANLLAVDSVMNRAVKVLTEDVCQDVEVIGWLYQFYISDRKNEVFAGFKKNKKAGAAEIPAATQLFTPDWIVRYLVENSLGRLWMLNNPTSRLVEQMDYYIAPVDEETDFLKVSSPEDLKIIDPACGSGHMLTYAFDLLYAIYEEEGYAPSDIPDLILTNNLYGTEIDPRAGALAAFALTMKARAKQRKFFNKHVEPNICVLEPIFFTPQELDFLLTRGGDPAAEEMFLNQFSEADLFGALIHPDDALTPLIREHITVISDEGNLFTRDLKQRAETVVAQAEYLASRYHVVVANPPYMGTKSMTPRLSEWAKQNYPNSKTDLFAMFIERGFDLIAANGYSAMVTMQSWMFLSSYEHLRVSLAARRKIVCLVHMDNMVMGIAFGTAGTVWRNGPSLGMATFCFVTPADLIEGRPAVFPTENQRLSNRDPGEFQKLPGAPIAYWLTTEEIENYRDGRLLAAVAEPKKGIDTGDNGEFLRMWWEVSRGKLALSNKEVGKWLPYNKGGGFRRWYGNREYVVNWANEGSAIRSRLSWSSRKPTLRNLGHMKQAGFTWGTISSGGFSARYTPPGAMFDNGGSTLFAVGDIDRFGALINSSTVDRYLQFLAPTINFQPGDIGNLPVPLAFDSVTISSQPCVELARADWDSHEESFDFQRPQVLFASGRLRAAVEAAEQAGITTAAKLQALESANNMVIADAYGMRDVVAAEVPIEKITLLCNPAYRYGMSLSKGEIAKRVRSELVTEFISHSVACMFGRYSLDLPGLILADQGSTLRDYLAKVPEPTFMPDAENVIPIVDGDWFEDDIVSRFRVFLRVAFGEEHFEENLRFVTESLGVTDLRDYFVKSFYKDHVKRYKKRPIYWLFSSPKGSFNALIYMHRYTQSTVSTVLNEYLREYRGKLAASLVHQERVALGGDSPREKAAAQKESDRIRKVLLELDEYEHDILYPLATQQIAIELDDGVKVNYPKFGAALKKIPGLEATDE
jgi:hypothetical protein